MRVEFQCLAPIQAARPRATQGGRMYNTARVAEWRRMVAFEARVAYGTERAPHAGPVALTIEAYGTTSDLDNVAKGIQDALNGLVFEDDRQVVDLHIKAPDRQFGKGGGVKRKASVQGVRVVVEAVS